MKRGVSCLYNYVVIVHHFGAFFLKIYDKLIKPYILKEN